MKKLLALVLALVMTLGLATVSSSAALSDFSDGNDVNYEEAMAVMNAVGVFVGDNGKLAPKDNLTRAQAAKIIAYLNLGESAAESLSKDITAFSDVPAGNWATGYITYCYNAGIIAGDGTGKFNPNDNVTGLQFAKMLLVTLGYEADREGLVGKDYALNTTKLAAKNELFKSNEGLSVNTPATREEAALYAFNALMAPTYEYDSASTTIKGADGLEVMIGGSNAKPVTTGSYLEKITNESNSGGTDTLQLGEKLYKNDLTLAGNGGVDDMGRPANVWKWKNDIVGKYADEADYTIVVKKTDKTYDEIFDDTSKSIKTDAITTVKRNGVDAAMGDTAAVGDIMEVYLSDTTANSVARVAITRYTVGKATGAAATRVDSGKNQIRVPGVTGLSSWIDTDHYFGATDIAKDDIVYFYSDNAATKNWYVAKADSFEGQLQGVKTNNALKKYTISGTDYIVSEGTNVGDVDGLGSSTTPAAEYNTQYQYFTDANGIIIAAKKIEETNKNYVMIETLKLVDNSAGSASIGAEDTFEARIVKMDGTVEVVKVAEIDGFEPVATGTALSSLDGATHYGTAATAAGANSAARTNTVGATTTADAQFYTLAKSSGGAIVGKYFSLNSTASLNAGATKTMLYTYEVNSDGEYEFKTAASADVATDAGATNDDINGDSTKTGTTYKPSTGKLNDVAVNDDTVFVVVNDPAKSSPKYTVYTGKGAAPQLLDNYDNLDDGDDDTSSGAHVAYVWAKEKSVATVVFVYNYGTKSASGEWIYIATAGRVGTTQVKVDGSTYNYNVYKALKSGESEVINLMVKTDLGVSIGLYDTLTYDAKTGALTGAKRADNQDTTGVFGYNVSGSTLSTKKTYGADTYAVPYNYPADAIVIYKDVDDNFTVGKGSDFSGDANDQIWVAKTNGSDNKVKVALIYERDTDETGVISAGGVTSTTPDKAYGTYAVKCYDGVAAGTVTVETKALCKVEIADAGTSHTVGTTAWGDLTFNVSVTAIGNGFSFTADANHTYLVRLTAEDGTISYFSIDVNA